MAKILILSNFFPPTKLTPSERIYSWAKYFKKYGLYPIIITRIWPEDTKGYESAAQNAGTEVIVERYENYEVHYLPYKNDLNERLSIKWGKGKFHSLYRIVLFLNLFLEPLFLYLLAPFYKNVLDYSKKIIKDQHIDKVLISAAPFMLFKVGYSLKKSFSKIALYADYRDDWTTSDICFNPNKNKPLEIVRRYLKYFEHKWLSSYKLFFTVSENYVEKIAALIKIPGFVAENGFMKENYQTAEHKLEDTFTITYIGYLYPTQPVEIFLEAISELILIDKEQIKVNFIGIKNQVPQYNRILKATKDISDAVFMTERIGKDECIIIQQASHVLLQVGHQGIKGSPGSKMYEYLALGKPVLVSPSDGDIVEDTLLKSGQAYIGNDKETCKAKIKELMELYKKGASLPIDQAFINTFDRQYISQKIVQQILN